jgi:hypothetical protein
LTYEIVRYESGLKEQVAELQRHLWGHDIALNRAYLDWKYEQNPYIADPLIWLAVSSGRVVGMRGLFGSCWEIGTLSEPVLVPCADDFVIAPRHRNRGLVAQIMSGTLDQLASHGYRCAFSLSAGAVTRIASLASGWRGAGSMREAQRKTEGLLHRLPAGLRKVPILWRYAEVVGRFQHRLARPLFRGLDRQAQDAPASRGAAVRVEQTPRVEAMAELVRRLGHDGRIRHVRDERYLGWRYRNPLHEYRFLYRERDRLEGYLVLQADRRDPWRGVNVVDWEATTPEIREELLLAAVARGGFSQLTVWTGTLPGDMLPVISRAGFLPVASGSRASSSPTILVWDARRQTPAQDIVLGGRRLLDPASWDMRMVYSMAG